jgi:hypothetical protein
MNIVQIQKDLRNVPMNALIRYVQDGNPEVPAYLALTELKRRKSMEQEYQARAAGQPKKTVAENLVDQARPQMSGIEALMPGQAPSEGVAGLPMREDMLAEKNFAGGGIVAFNGEDGSYVYGSDAPYNAYTSTASEDVTGKIEEGMRQATQNIVKKMQLGIPLTQDEKNVLQSRGFVNAQTGPTSEKPVDIPVAKAPVAKPGIAPPPVAVKDVAPVAANAGITSALPKAMTLDEAIQQQKDAYEKMGVNANFYKEQAAKNEAEREALKADRSQAGWMALTRAGLGMAAGKSPFALQNIAAGATEGLTQYGVDLKDIKKDAQLIKAADNKLAEAQYLQSRGDAEGALKAMREHEKMVETAKQHQDTLRTTLEAARIGATSRSGIDEDTIAKGFAKAVENGEYKNTPADYQRYKSLFTAGAGSTSIPSDIQSILSKYGKAAAK